MEKGKTEEQKERKTVKWHISKISFANLISLHILGINIFKMIKNVWLGAKKLILMYKRKSELCVCLIQNFFYGCIMVYWSYGL